MLAKNHFFSYLSSPPLLPPPQTQIIFESRLGAHDVLNNCRMTVDGTDFCIPQKGVAMKGNAFASHSYELGVNILVGNLVWIQGPYPVGKYTDIKIFNKVLRNFLEPGKRVEADEGYRGHHDKTKLGGPVEKMSFFQIAHMTKVSSQIRSSMCQYDVYKVSSKKMSGRGPLGVSKSTFFFGGVSSGLGYRIFAGFQVLSTHLSHVDDTLSSPHHNIDIIT